jgi:hypothetical protein
LTSYTARTRIYSGQFIRLEIEEVVLAPEDRQHYDDFIFVGRWKYDDLLAPDGIAGNDAMPGESVEVLRIGGIRFAIPVARAEAGTHKASREQQISDRIFDKLGVRIDVRWYEYVEPTLDRPDTPFTVYITVVFENKYVHLDRDNSRTQLYILPEILRTIQLPPSPDYIGDMIDRIGEDLGTRAANFYLALHAVWLY